MFRRVPIVVIAIAIGLACGDSSIWDVGTPALHCDANPLCCEYNSDCDDGEFCDRSPGCDEPGSCTALPDNESHCRLYIAHQYCSCRGETKVVVTCGFDIPEPYEKTGRCDGDEPECQESDDCADGRICYLGACIE